MAQTQTISTYSPEQQAEHRRVLVAALRSGDYEQARGQLRDGDGYCPLASGVS